MAGNIPCSPSALISRVLANPAISISTSIYFTPHPPLPLSLMSTRARSTRSTASSTNTRLRKPRPPRVQVPEPVHWLFRTNIPRKRQSYIPASPRRRNFFGMGEIIGVVTNPAATVRSLTESKRMLDEARQEIQETRERSQIRPTHTFSRLPGFFPRRSETQAIQRALEGEPSFTVLFGAPSVGKTALLREILSHPRYHVLHFDLRISGFADLESLYTSLSVQMEGYFEELSKHGGWYEEGSSERVCLSESEIKAEGWDTFEAEAFGFKHERIAIQKRTEGGEVKPSDIARLMELFQSSLLRYREFAPNISAQNKKEQHRRRHASEDTVVAGSSQASGSVNRRWYSLKRKQRVVSSPEPNESEPEPSDPVDEERRRKRGKRVPVLFFDEAHKLPHLIPSAQTMQTLLDSTLVLTKQDRLCHVVHATSDPFYQGWLSRAGILWYCKMISIGDLSKGEMRAYFRERVLPRLNTLPQNARRLDFETLYDAFGGKVAHWYDFVTDYVNSGGAIGIKQCSHFLQAHALLNLHIIHSSQAPGGGFDSPANGANPSGSLHNTTANMSTEAHRSSPETFLHPSLGAAGFRMYQAGANAQSQQNLNYGMLGSAANPLIASFTPYEGVGASPEFTPMQLLKVMSRFTTGGVTYLPYFHLCRELGAKAVDGMIRGKVVDVKWTDGIPGAVDLTRAGNGMRPISLAATNSAGNNLNVNTNANGHLSSQAQPSLSAYGMQSPEAGASSTMLRTPMQARAPSMQQHPQVSSVSNVTGTNLMSGSTTAVNFSNASHQHLGQSPPPMMNAMPAHPPPVFSEEDEGSAADVMVPVSEDEIVEQQRSYVQQPPYHEVHSHMGQPPPPFSQHHYADEYDVLDEMALEEDEEEEVIGPKLFPVSPIMRYAMREVIKEYEDDRSVSEYASLSDVDEY